MFRSILSKSLRDYRVPILGWGFGMALFMVRREHTNDTCGLYQPSAHSSVFSAIPTR